MDRRPSEIMLVVFTCLLILPLQARLGMAQSGSDQPATKIGMIETDERRNGMAVSYLTESRPDNKVILDANNGFFDKTEFHAVGGRSAPDWDAALIKQHFSSLATRSSDADNARWYVWLERPGTLRLNVKFDGPVSTFQITLKGHDETVQQRSTSSGSVSLESNSAGRHLISLSCLGTTPATRIRKVELGGTAGKDARVLRARWRPAAIHTQYHSSTCPQTRLWVFESQSLEHASSYSPMSTQFGYFGGSFNAQCVAEGNMNFSVWAANSRAKTAPPLATMPHLIATGNPKASFGGFGHEGSGIKIRDWNPLDHHPRSIIQALRVETIDGHDLFTGYLFDQRVQRWILFAQAKRPTKRSGKRSSRPSAGEESAPSTYLRPTSFCEVPGPPAVQRSGDVRRVIRRRGWFFGADKRWHAVDRQTTKSGKPSNQFIQSRDGWFEMATGGIEFFVSKSETVLAPSDTLPRYLNREYTRQLFNHPVAFTSNTPRQLQPHSATIDYTLKKAGSMASGVLHYGPVDCLTFVKRRLHGTEQKGVSSEMLDSSRTWANASVDVPLTDGLNSIPISGLDSGTTYYYRLLVTNAQGKSWDTNSGSFTTPHGKLSPDQ